jgi:hypothetical protein
MANNSQTSHNTSRSVQRLAVSGCASTMRWKRCTIMQGMHLPIRPSRSLQQLTTALGKLDDQVLINHKLSTCQTKTCYNMNMQPSNAQIAQYELYTDHSHTARLYVISMTRDVVDAVVLWLLNSQTLVSTHACRM